MGGEEADPSESQWSIVEMLLASIIDELRWMRHEFRQVNSANPGEPPKPVPRPGVKGPRKKRLTMEQRMRLDPRLRKQAEDNG